MNTKKILCMVTLLLMTLITACEVVQTAEIISTEDPEGQEEAALTDVAQDENENQAALPLLGDVDPPMDSQTSTTNQNALELTEIQYLGKGNINAITWSPSGNPIALATVTGIYLIDPQTKEEVHFTKTPSNRIEFLPGSPVLASVEESRVIFRDLINDRESLILGGQIEDTAEIAFSPSGDIVAIASTDGTVIIKDLVSEKVVSTINKPETSFYHLSFSQDGKILVSNVYYQKSDHSDVLIWDVESGDQIVTASEIGGSNSAVSPNSELIAAGGYDDPLLLLDFNGDVQKILDEEPKPVFCLAFSPDGKVLGSITLNNTEGSWTDTTLKLWDTENGELLHTLDDEAAYHYISFSPDGKQVAAASAEQVKLWDVETGQEIGIITDQSESKQKEGYGKAGVNDFAWSPDGNTLALATFSGVSLLNIETYEEIQLSTNGNQPQIGHIITFSPDGKMLAVSVRSSSLAKVEVYDVESQGLLFTLDDFEDMGVFGIAFSPDNTRLATGWGNPWGGGSGSIKVWDMSTGTKVSELGRDDNETIYNLAYNNDGKLLAGISGIGQVHIWNIAEENEEMALIGTSGYGFAVAFSPDGRLLAVGGAASDGMEYDYEPAELYLFDLSSGDLVYDLEGHQAIIRSLTFNPDGGVLASASVDGTVRLWDTHTGEQLAVLDIPDATSVGFSPDGTLLATAGFGDVLRLWRVAEPNANNSSTFDSPSVRESLSSEEIRQRADAFEAVVAKNADAWNAKDLDAIEAVLTDDIHFVDVSGGDNLNGISQVMSMARIFCGIFPNLQRQATSHYIGVEEGMAIYDYWGWRIGAKQYTREDPFIYVFLYKIQDDLISEWHLFEGIEALEANFISETASVETRAVISSYASTWSSGDPKSVAEMYANDAVRHDSLFEENQQGTKAIKDFAESFFTTYPDVQWTSNETFGEKPVEDKPQAVGSSFKIEVTNPSGIPCDLEAVVLLYVLEGKIIQEDIYYEPDSLIQCGWAE